MNMNFMKMVILPIKKGKKMNNENEIYFNFLDDLRDSGETNMFGSPSYLVNEFGIHKREAMDIVSQWMKRKENEQ